MKLIKQAIFSVLSATLFFAACNDEKKVEDKNLLTVKGLYCFGPSVKSFTMCEDGREFWVTDSVKSLELAYSNLNFEKPYEAVYVELQGHYIKSVDSLAVSSDYDSTLVVTKIIKISKTIPEGPCSQ